MKTKTQLGKLQNGNENSSSAVSLETYSLLNFLSSAEAMTDGRGTAARLIVKHDGNVSWLNPMIFTSSCEIDITFFPLDDQSCQLKFGSWSYSSNFLDVHPRRASADLSS